MHIRCNLEASQMLSKCHSDAIEMLDTIQINSSADQSEWVNIKAILASN